MTIEEPPSTEELQDMLPNNGRISFVVHVPLKEMVKLTHEGLIHFVKYEIAVEWQNIVLSDIFYNVEGHTPGNDDDRLGGVVILRVNAKLGY